MMTHVTVVGTIATEPKELILPSGIPVCSFRLANGERKLNRDTQTWEDGPTNWYTVNAYRTLATHAAASLQKGERVIVTGRLRIKQWETTERNGTSVEIEADALGPELRWGTTQFTKSQFGRSSDESTEREAEWASPMRDVSERS